MILNDIPSGELTVKQIDEDLDFGCEERIEGSPVMAVVTLTDNEGREFKLRQPDKMLYELNINDGDRVVIAENGELRKP